MLSVVCKEQWFSRKMNQQADALQADEEAIAGRDAEFSTAIAGKASMRTREATMQNMLFFLLSRKTSRSVISIKYSQPRDAVEHLCWFNYCGPRRRTVVHAQE